MVGSVQGELINSPSLVIQLIVGFDPYTLLMSVLRFVANFHLALNMGTSGSGQG